MDTSTTLRVCIRVLGLLGGLEKLVGRLIPIRGVPIWGILLFGSADTILAQDEPLLPVQKDGRWGYVDTTGTTVISYQFESAKLFVDSLAPARQEGKWGFINRVGTFVIQPVFDDAEEFAEGMAVVRVGSRRGYVNEEGVLAIPAEFERAKRFSEGFAAVRRRGMWRFINRNGHDAFSPVIEFQLAGSFSEGLAPVRVNGLWGYVDCNGEWAISPRFHDAKEFRSGLAPVRFEPLPSGTVGYINRTGATVIEPQFTWGEPFSEGLAPIQVGDFWGYIDSTGTTVIPPSFAAAGPYHRNVARVTDAVFGREVYIDRRERFLMYYSEGTQNGRFGALTLQRVRIASVPAGAAVYLIPLFEWESDPDLLRKPDRLRLFQVPEGATEVRTRAYERVYMVVFVLDGKIRQIPLDVVRNGSNTAIATF